jgi:hypothetical protein
VLNKSYRAANEHDIQATTGSRGSLGCNILVVCLPVSIISFGGVYFFRRSVLAASLVATSIFVASSLSNIRFFRNVKRRQNSMVVANAVEILEVTASRVMDIEPQGDNAPAYCFFVGEREALLLVGQWLLEYGSFPSESFRLHRWSDTGQPIRIEMTGPPIQPEHSNIHLQPNHSFGKVELIKATPETLQDDLDRTLIRDRTVHH